MKKQLLFIAALFVGIGLSAQTTWTAYDYATDNSLSDGDTAIIAGSDITSGSITMTAIESDPWEYHVTDGEFTYNNVAYGYSYVQGQNSGKSGYIDESRAYALFTSTEDGTLDVAFKFGYNKGFYVAEYTEADLEVTDLSTSDSVSLYTYEDSTYFGGYFDPADLSYYTGDCKYTDTPDGTFYTGVTLNITAGNYYYVWFGGSKLMLCGFTFTAGSGSAVHNLAASDATVVKTEYYNILGSKLAEPVDNSITIIKKTMSDGSIVTTKGIFLK